MHFRDYRENDFDELNALWVSLGMGGPERGDDHEVIERTLKYGGKLIVLEDEPTGEIVGSSWMSCDGRRMFLHHFGIKTTHQGKGLGTRLAVESLKFITEQGYQVKLEVHKENQAAKRIYEKVGFFAFTDYDIYMIRDVRSIPTGR